MLRSSWSEVTIPSPVVSPPPSSGSSNDSNSKTHAFFASTFDTPLPPPTLAKSGSAQSLTASDGTRTRSLNVDFFAVTPSASLLQLSPPPSLRAPPISRRSSTNTSSGSGSDSPASSSPSDSSHSLPTPSLQLLSRLFPSRYSTFDESSLVASSGRKILELDNTADELFVDTNVTATDETPKSTPKPTPMIPKVLTTPTPPLDTSSSIPIASRLWTTASPPGQLSMSPKEDPSIMSTAYQSKVNTSSSISIDMLPTPSGSRDGSIYEASRAVSLSGQDASEHLGGEQRVESLTADLRPGLVICSSVAEGDCSSLKLVRTLGQGSFSSVWLARDESASLEKVIMSRKASIKRQQINGEGIVRRKSSRRSRRKMVGTKPWKYADLQETKKSEGTQESLAVEQNGGVQHEAVAEGSRLVALKLTERALCEANDRTRVSFIREVEVLKHISHPSIVSYIHSFTTPTHHCLVLEHIDGEELFDLINSDDKYAQMDEPRLRRMWGELCKAVGWLHEVALVHRDIKLENILLTRNLGLPLSSAPLIKLTDFGLSRFVDPKNPLLTTRCGSESYAAPEIITGRTYDGSETDAWACGVVLYALATRKLPFESGYTSSSRKAMLMRIAKCEYGWPKDEQAGFGRSEGLRSIVGRLLVRDPKKRSKIKYLWDDEWMLGEGAPVPPPLPEPPFPSLDTPEGEEQIAEDLVEDDVVDDGLIVDGDRISSVASQELQ